MEFTNEEVQQYKELCQKYFGTELSDREARIKLADLVMNLELIYRPVSVEQIHRAITKSIKAELTKDTNHGND